MPSRSMSFSVRPPGSRRGDQDQLETSRSVRSLAKASSRVAMPFIGASALAMARIRPGTRGVGRRHEDVVDAEQDRPRIRAGSTPKSRAMSRAGGSEGGEDRGGPAGPLGLHPQEAVPAAQAQLLAQGRGGGEVDAAVEGDRVVDGGDQRQAHLLDVEHPVAEHLVVVGDVEVVERARSARRATRRREVLGSGKPAVHIVRTSSTSIRSRNSLGRGVRNGSGSR